MRAPLILAVVLAAIGTSAAAQFIMKRPNSSNQTSATSPAAPFAAGGNTAPPSTGLNPAPGVSSMTGMGISPGEFYYYNNAGVGYYAASPFSTQFPSPPVVTPFSASGFGSVGSRMGYWHSPSGYYYPVFPRVYVPGAAYPTGNAIYSIDQGGFIPAKPPVGQVIHDLREFLDDAKSKNQLEEKPYERFSAALADLESQSAQLAQRNQGMLDSSDQAQIRKQLDSLITEITRAVTP